MISWIQPTLIVGSKMYQAVALLEIKTKKEMVPASEERPGGKAPRMRANYTRPDVHGPVQ